MGEHHLCNANRAAPANVISHTYLELSIISFRLCRQKYLHFFYIILQKRLEVPSIAEPEERPKFLLELVLADADLLLDALLTVFVNGKHIVE